MVSTKILMTFDIISILHYLSFDIMSHSAFITFNIIAVHYLPFNVLSHSAFITLTLCSFLLLFRILYFVLLIFVPFDVFSINLLSHLTFYPSRFFTDGFVYFDVLSVNHFFRKVANTSF